MDTQNKVDLSCICIQINETLFYGIIQTSYLCYVTTHFEKFRILKKENSKCLESGTKTTHVEKNVLFSKFLNIGHINAL